jgi:hypothetical protein
VFAVLGFLVPFVVTFGYGIFGSSPAIAIKLWFTSGMAALDTPHAKASVLYTNLAVAWIANILIYAALGALVGLIVSYMRRGSRSSGSR